MDRPLSVVLAIDTTSTLGGVALLDRDGVLAEIPFELERNTVATLIPRIADLLQQSHIGREKLDALAVSIGPGSFTGVRIGIATAQGIAAGLDLPVYGISSLAILAGLAESTVERVAAVRRARDGESYLCVYDRKATPWHEVVPEGRYDEAELPQHLKGLESKAIMRDDAMPGPHAVSLARLAMGQAPAQAFPRGEGIVARLYSPGFRQRAKSG